MKVTKDFVFMRLPLLLVSLFFGVAGLGTYYALRSFWVFYDPMMGFLGGATGVFIIFAVNLAFVLFLTALRLHVPKKEGKAFWNGKIFSVLSTITFVLSALSFLAVIAVLIYNDEQTNRALWLFVKNDVPLLSVFIFAVVSLLILPALKKKARVAFSVLLAVCVLLCGVSAVFPLTSYKIESDPVVLDTGKDFAVVFSTNEKGTGFIEYSFEGETHTVYAQKNGRRIADRKIHCVNVPYEHLKDNPYTVGSTRVIDEFAYGSRLGKTVTAGPFTLSVPEGKEQTYLMISDWHTYVKEANEAISHIGDYDGVILLGDPAPGMDFEDEAREYVVKFGGNLTHGAIPAIYVRGNHETRGSFADDFPEYIGYDSFYYTVERGDFTFVVLDSGEDKPDDHVEYGGLDDYTLNRTEMIEWLDELEVENDKVIALSHAWQVSEPESDLSARAWTDLEKLGARFVFSGHEHRCGLAEGKNEEDAALLASHSNITAYIDGGHHDNIYIASKITLSDGGVKIFAVDRNGNEVFNESYGW